MDELMTKETHPLKRKDKGAVVGLRVHGKDDYQDRVAWIEPGSTYTDIGGRTYRVEHDGSLRRIKR